jgi:hypothetical protein
VVRNVTKTEAFATGLATAFSVSGLEGSGMTAAAMWRPMTPAGNPAQHQTVAISHAVRTRSFQLATLHTQKQYVVTTPDAGRGNKGTSPWGFPV